jgi:hypothetical protein
MNSAWNINICPWQTRCITRHWRRQWRRQWCVSDRFLMLKCDGTITCNSLVWRLVMVPSRVSDTSVTRRWCVGDMCVMVPSLVSDKLLASVTQVWRYHHTPKHDSEAKIADLRCQLPDVPRGSRPHHSIARTRLYNFAMEGHGNKPIINEWYSLRKCLGDGLFLRFNVRKN